MGVSGATTRNLFGSSKEERPETGSTRGTVLVRRGTRSVPTEVDQ